MKNPIHRFHWLPRILCILAILFISIFALDAFDSKLSWSDQLLDFLLHLIPSFILLLILIVAWKRELVGGILFSIIGFGFTPVVFMLNYNRNHSILESLGIVLMITIPFLIIGMLFVASHLKRKKSKTEN